jgi:hypothetical protein
VVIWLITSLTGVGISQFFDLGKLLLFFAGTFLALVAERLFEDWVRPEGTRGSFRWFTVVSGVSVLTLAMLVHLYSLVFLIPLGGVAFLLVILPPLAQYRFGSRVGGEYLGIAGLTLAAPAGYYIMTGSFDLTAWMLWLTLLLYHFPTNSYIRTLLSEMKVEFAELKTDSAKSKPKRMTAYWLSILQHVLSLGVAGFLTAARLIPPFTILAFSVFSARLVRVGRRKTYTSAVLRVGLRESMFLAVFSAILILSYKLG